MQTGVFQPLRVAIIGTGYVGLTTGVAMAYLGHTVFAMDTDARKVDLLRSGKSPIHEQGLKSLMREAKENLAYTTDTGEAVRQAELIMIAVGTPSKTDGQADTQYVEAAARSIAQELSPGQTCTVVVKSTVPVGSNRRVKHVMYEVLAQRGLTREISVHVASNPEFLREGTALHDTLYPDRIVVGAESSTAVDGLRQLYQPILEQTFVAPAGVPRPDNYHLPPMLTTDPASAELIKYASNAFLATKISFINEIAVLCERVDADVNEVARGMGLDSRISAQFLRAGLGWGGSCFPKDTAALVAMGHELVCPMKLIGAARDVNLAQRRRVVERLQDTLKGLRGRVIGVLGLAFKPGTDDMRESPALDIIKNLLEREAHVRVHDPVAMENARALLEGTPVQFCPDPLALASGTDAVILATEWPEYRTLDLKALADSMRTPVLYDARNIYDRQTAEEAGLTYLAVGR